MIDTAGDVAANPEPFGLVRADGSYRPAFRTFQHAATMLAGATRATRDRWDDVGQVTVEQPGGRTTVLFCRVPGPRVAQVPALGATATLVDMWGSSRLVSSENGVFTIELPAAPCSQSAGDYCIIGGPTYYLVQGAPAPALPAAPPPAETPAGTAPAVTPTAELAAELTAQPTVRPTKTPTHTATGVPTAPPTAAPTLRPTALPTAAPSPEPVASAPAPAPSGPPAGLIAGAIALAGGSVALILWRLRR
jgi:hypothetical protein